MQLNLQHADPQADPHDAIAAQLRDLAPRIADDTAALSIAPTAAPESSREPSLEAAPLNDNIGNGLDTERHPASRKGILLLIVCAGIMSAAAWYAYGDKARQQISHLAPQFQATALVPASTASGESSNSASQTVAPQAPSDSAQVPDTKTVPTESAAAPVAQTTAPAQAALPPEVVQSLESMTQEIASLKQTIEQLQSGQQQLSRDVAKLNELEVRRKAGAQAVKPSQKPQAQPQRSSAVAPTYRAPALYPPQPPSQTHTYSQSTAQRDTYVPQAAPTQLPPQPGDASAPRPPMPLR